MSSQTFVGRSDGAFVIRRLQETDYDLGFLDCIGNLSEVGDVSEDQFIAQLAARERQGTVTLVIESIADKRIVATGTILFDYKFTRSCGLCGHIEDVAVCREYRGQRLGQRIIDALQEEAHHKRCYKIILDCTSENKTFYEKQGFYQKELQMRYDIKTTAADYKANSPFVNQHLPSEPVMHSRP